MQKSKIVKKPQERNVDAEEKNAQEDELLEKRLRNAQEDTKQNQKINELTSQIATLLEEKNQLLEEYNAAKVIAKYSSINKESWKNENDELKSQLAESQQLKSQREPITNDNNELNSLQLQNEVLQSEKNELELKIQGFEKQLSEKESNFTSA